MQQFHHVMASFDSREDTDRLLSYYTKQQVNFLDRKLGLTYYTCCVCIVAYIVGYMFIYKKGYLQYEYAKGAVATHVYGDALAVSSGKLATRYFSSEDITYPGLENGNVFIATRQTVHNQKRGMCEDSAMPCHRDDQCTKNGGGRCGKNGYCIERSWCSHDKPEIYEIETANMQIWARSSIQFIKIAPEKVFSTESDNPLPQRGYNTFTVSDLLLKCEPLPVRYEEVAELGAAIEVQFIWDCPVKRKDPCKPLVKARRLDTIFDPDNIGFGFSYPEYVDKDNRMLNEVRGVRIFFRTTGVGWMMSLAATITKASMGASLFALANIVADLLMTKIFHLRSKYNARKYENTPDFSEYMEELQVKKANAVSEKAIDEEERRVHLKEMSWMKQLDEEDD